MSRSTHFVGLTDDAEKFVNNIKKLNIKNETHGMFLESIPLGVWIDQFSIYKEIVVAEPWSSGPMIFTALGVYGRDEEHKLFSSKPDYIFFDWVLDPTVVGQYDRERGRYYV